jgi:DNA polymerase-3 subunit gamma/tau
VALALYRKYRPRTFSEVIGQEHVTEPLAQALRSGRLHHAYLFSGPRGCGKTSSARILARSLNCERGPTPEPCGECGSCRDLAIDGAGSIDVIEIDAASHGGVDDARELREKAFFAPVGSRFKVYVIDEAHMVSSAGFNALLKLVEEPPEYVKFVFATTEPEKVLGTIRSRTHHYPFRLIPPGVLRPFLEQLCRTEGVAVEPAVFPLVVRAGAGSVRDSLSVLDQLIAGAGQDGVSYARAVALLGVTDASLIDEICEALVAGDGAAVYATVDRVSEAGHDPRRFAADLLERVRDLIVLRQVPDAAAKGLLDAPDDQLGRMASQASLLGMATLSRFADIVHDGLSDMRGATAPRLVLELICARLLLPAADSSVGALLQRLERLERRIETAGAGGWEQPSPPQAPVQPAPPAVSSQPPTRSSAGAAPDRASPVMVAQDEPSPGNQPRRQPVSDSAKAVIGAAAVRGAWDGVLSAVGDRSKRAAAVVREATVEEVQGDVLVLRFKHSVHATMLSNSPDILIEALNSTLGGRWQVRCVTASDPSSPTPRSYASPRPGVSPPAVVSSPPSSATPPETPEAWPTTAVPGGGAQPAAPAAKPSAPPAAARRAPDRAARSSAPQQPSAQATDDLELLGFAPGDEPLDDDGQGVHETSEQQAVRLITEAFGAERI